MLTSIFGIWASEPPGPGERLKRLGLIGLKLWMGVTFVVKSTLTKKCALETIATSLENSEAQLTKIKNKTNNLILNLTLENMTQHSRIE